MAYTKVQIYNLALGALLLTRRINDIDADNSTEVRVLNTHWETALNSTLEDMDLDGTSSTKVLELLSTNPTIHWQYAYKYPTDCTFLRRIQSYSLKDTRTSQIPRRVAVLSGQKVIFCNEPEAVIEYISTDVPLAVLSSNAGLAVAYKLAMLASALITGKSANKVKEDIQKSYAMARMEAQETDRLENATFDDAVTQSEFVEARTS